MRVAIDIQVVAEGNRSGLFSCLRSTIQELRLLTDDQVWMFAELTANFSQRDAATVSAAMGGIPLRLVRRPQRFYRVWRRASLWNRADIVLHNLHATLPPATHAANAFLVPDVIPLAVDYGVPNLAASYRPFYDTAVRHGDVILMFTEHAKLDFLERVGGSPELIRVVPLAASPEFHPVPDKESLQMALAPLGLDGAPYVLMVATVEVRKNHAVLLRAFERMLMRDPALPHRLVLVGGKWIGHEAVFELIRELRLTDRVTYLGFCESLASVYAGADAFVFPSLYEGFGLPVLEAMASGVPVLAADATSLPEVVGDAGVLFDPHDVEQLSIVLQRLLSDRMYHDDLAQRGLERAAGYSWRRTAEQYVHAFEFGIRRFKARAH